MNPLPIRSILAGALLAATAVPMAALAQGIPSVELEATTDYRSRGLSWSDGDPALRAAIDVPVTPSISLSAQGVTLLVVEHDMHFVSRLCEEVVVLNFGQRIFHGPPAAAQRDPAVLEAYLGADDAA